MATEIEVAWAAGIFEGEGTITHSQVNKQTGRKYIYPRLSMGMNDEDVVRKFYRIIACGSIYYDVQKPPKNLIHYKWATASVKDSQIAYALLEPYLGDRRRIQAKEVDLKCTSSLILKPQDLTPRWTSY